MKINVGLVDRALRLLLGLFLIWLGLLKLEGFQGNIIGILVALIALLPFTMSATGKCPVFNWFGIHSLTKKECKKHGHPYK